MKLCNQLTSRTTRQRQLALLQVQSDIADYLDGGKAVLLVLLDLSEAFDTLHHSKLLATLHLFYGVCGTALEWFVSYISDHTQSINISGASSKEIHIMYGVPQGAVLGPILFPLYTKPLHYTAAQYLLP